MTQQTLADLVGGNRVTYTNWENGKREPELDKGASFFKASDSKGQAAIGVMFCDKLFTLKKKSVHCLQKTGMPNVNYIR